MLGGGDLALLVDSNELARRALEVPSAPEQAPVVLVVDDSRGARQVVAATLAVGGFNTLVAEDGDVAMDLLGRTQVDALVVDFSMPGSDGVVLAQHVRASSDMPIIMVSGVAGEGDQRRAMEAGIDAYFDKSDLRQGALVDTLVSLLSQRGSPQKVEASQ